MTPRRPSAAPEVSARLVASDGAEIVRVFPLSAYDLEVLAVDVRRLERGARLELAVRGTDDEVSEIEAEFAWVAARGVDLVVERPGPPVLRLTRSGAPCATTPARDFDVGDVVRPDDLSDPIRCRVIAIERLRVPAGVLQFLTLEPCGGSASGAARLVRLSHAVSRVADAHPA